MQPEMRGVPGAPAPQRHSPGPAGKTKNRRRLRAWIAEELRISMFIVIVGGALIIAALALWFWSSSTSYGQSTYVNSKEYQALFLTNGQVYFGKITKMNQDYLVMHDIFYLQSSSNNTQNPQPSNKNNNLTLVKLGLNELHAPEDTMVVNQSQVSFWENMKDSSKVVDAIKQYKANPNGSNSNSSTNSSTPASSSGSNSTTGQ